MFSGGEFHVDMILYAKEDLWVFYLSFGIERYRSGHVEMLYMEILKNDMEAFLWML